MLSSVATLPAAAAVVFNGVAAGDMGSSDALLWTRADNGGGTTALSVLVSTDPGLASGVTYAGATSTSADFTAKIHATGLTSNTKYYYQFADTGSGARSSVGSFFTAPAANQATEVKFGFSGDADGRFRPYTLMSGFGTASQVQSQNLKFFTFLGDTMYETASGTAGGGSPTVPALTSSSTSGQQAAALAAYYNKYLENVSGVDATGNKTAAGQQGLQAMLAATGTYTVLDNHEMGNQSLQSGGAPLAAGARVTPAQGFDVNTTGAYDNQTNAYKTLQKAFFDYHPTKASLDGSLASTGPTVTNAGDGRSNGTPQQYFAQQQGKNVTYIQLDDRTYRDARLGKAGGGDDVTSGRQNNPNRTMLGSTQLSWLKQTLLDAQAAGTPWKFIAISTPIDQTGPAQDAKSWFGGYAAERNEILKFIADNKISNVVFLTTDDHLTRMTALTYQTTFGDASTTTAVPGTFQIVTGPIGAGGPDAITDHSFANIQALNGLVNTGLLGMHEPIIGLCAFGGLSNVHREGDNSGVCSSVDFFSPDTFNYALLDVSQDGRSLSVDVWGMPSYQQNVFPIGGLTPTNVLGFTLQAGFVASVPEPASLAVFAAGLAGLAGLRRRRR